MSGMSDFSHFFQIIGNIVKDITLAQNRKFQMEKMISMRLRFNLKFRRQSNKSILRQQKKKTLNDQEML